MSLMRTNRDSLLAVLEAFIHDPLLQWVLHDNRKDFNHLETKLDLAVVNSNVNESRISQALTTTSTNGPANNSNDPSLNTNVNNQAAKPIMQFNPKQPNEFVQRPHHKVYPHQHQVRVRLDLWLFVLSLIFFMKLPFLFF